MNANGLGICVVRLTTEIKIKYDTHLVYNIYTLLCTVIFNSMIIVWNNNHGDIYGFKDIEEYKEWIIKNLHAQTRLLFLYIVRLSFLCDGINRQ